MQALPPTNLEGSLPRGLVLLQALACLTLGAELPANRSAHSGQSWRRNINLQSSALLWAQIAAKNPQGLLENVILVLTCCFQTMGTAKDFASPTARSYHS
jgi:hypothetical protein